MFRKQNSLYCNYIYVIISEEMIEHTIEFFFMIKLDYMHAKILLNSKIIMLWVRNHLYGD